MPDGARKGGIMTSRRLAKPPPASPGGARRRRRPDHAGLPPATRARPVRCAPCPALRAAGGRGHRGPGRRVERDGPARPTDRGVRGHRELPERPARGRARGPAGGGPHGQGGPDRTPGRPGCLLPGDLPRSRRHEDDERASGRPVPDRSGRRAGRHLRVVGRHRRTGLGHQPGLGRAAPLRGHAGPRAGLLRQQRRHDLRRRAAQGRGRPPGGRHLEEPGDRGEVEGGGDARGVSAATTATT